MTLLDRMKAMPGHKIRRMQQLSSSIWLKEMADIDLTAVQLMALAAIRDMPGIDATRLSEQIWYDRATIGEVIGRLERKGHIRRTAGDQDRRIKQLHITLQGETILARALPGLERVQVRLVSALDEAEQAEFLDMVTRIIDDVDAPGRA